MLPPILPSPMNPNFMSFDLTLDFWIVRPKRALREENPKSEARNPKQIQNSNAQNAPPAARFRHLNFGDSNLFRVSDLMSPSFQDTRDRRLELREARPNVPGEVDSQRAPRPRLQGCEVAGRLSRDHIAEGIRLPRDLDIRRGGRRDLKEDAGLRASLVKLPGRMKEPRPEPERCGDSLRVTDFRANAVELLLALTGRRDIGHDREVVSRTDRSEQRPQRFLIQGLRLPPPASRLPPRKDLVGAVLGLLNVGLIEGIDAEKPSRHRRRELPAKHLRPEVQGVLDFKERRRMFRLHERLDRPAHLPPAGAPDSCKETVVAVHVRRPRDLPLDGENALAFLAGTLRDQLLDPHAESGNGPSDKESQLVASGEGGGCDRRSEPQARIVLPLSPATLRHSSSPA